VLKTVKIYDTFEDDVKTYCNPVGVKLVKNISWKIQGKINKFCYKLKLVCGGVKINF